MRIDQTNFSGRMIKILPGKAIKPEDITKVEQETKNITKISYKTYSQTRTAKYAPIVGLIDGFVEGLGTTINTLLADTKKGYKQFDDILDVVSEAETMPGRSLSILADKVKNPPKKKTK